MIIAAYFSISVFLHLNSSLSFESIYNLHCYTECFSVERKREGGRKWEGGKGEGRREGIGTGSRTADNFLFKLSPSYDLLKHI